MPTKIKKHWGNLKVLYQRERFLVTANLVVMTVTFLILGFFLSTAVGMQTAIKTLEDQAQVTLFFEDEYPETEILTLQTRLQQDARIDRVTYISKEDAFKIFTDLNRDEPILLEAVSKDILPASLEIRAERLAELDELASEFEGLEGVEEVKFFKDIVDQFRYWANVTYVVGGILTLTFVGLSVAIIMATLRVTISSKGDEIEIMKLVGANDTYVREPLLYHGLFFGIFGAGLASLILVFLFTSVQFLGVFGVTSAVVLLPGVRVFTWVFMVLLVLLLLIAGGLLGYIGSKLAVQRYLEY